MDTSNPKMKKVLRKKATQQKIIPKEPSVQETDSVRAWWTNKIRKLELMEDKLSSITVKFVTKQNQYAISGAPIAVQENLKTETLNNVVCSLLEKASFVESIPTFEFMIDGKILVGSIGQHLTDQGKSFEAITEVEYFERYPPPTPRDKLEHDDWVSSVMSCGNWLVTGCYDNTVQLWSVEGMIKGRGKKAHKLTIPAHKAPVKAVAWLNSKGRLMSFVSCSIDQTAIVWDWDSNNNSVECMWECRGHSQSVECLGVNPKRTKFATGSWDNTLKIWNAESNSNSNVGHEEEPDKKKIRKSKEERLRTPLMTLAGHTENVSGVDWLDAKTLISCSWDHSIRLWNMDIGGMVSQISGNVAFFCITYSPINKMILAGCADRNIRLYDPRSQEGSVVLCKYISNKKWIPSIKWSKQDENLFVSGGYDSTVRVWDLRSTNAPLYNLLGHRGKVLSVDWSDPRHIASGSADCTAQVYLT